MALNSCFISSLVMQRVPCKQPLFACIHVLSSFLCRRCQKGCRGILHVGESFLERNGSREGILLASERFNPYHNNMCDIMKSVSSQYLAHCNVYRSAVHASRARHFVFVRTGSVFSREDARRYSTGQNKSDPTDSSIKQEGVIHEVLQQRKEKLRQTEQRLRTTGQTLLRDIRETKEKMKEKVEEIIERENVLTVPNVLCVTRILLSPYLGYLIIQTDFNLALGVFAFAGVTDLLDGWIARNFENQSSKMGSFLDPMADKVLVGTLFVTLTYVGLIPVSLTSLIIARDVLLVAAGFYIRYKSLPPPITLSRYFDVTHATAQLAPTFISKVNTVVQLSLLATTLAAPVFCYIDHPVLQALWYVTATTTIASALSYVFTKNTYQFLKDKSKKKN